MNEGEINYDDEKKGANMMKSGSKSVIPVLAIIVSILAVFISIRGCLISQEALKISQDDFNAERSIVLQGITARNNEVMQLLPVDSGMKLQVAAVHLPAQIDTTIRRITPPDHIFHIIMLKHYLAENLDSLVQRREGYITVIDNTSIPIVIESHYIAKGEGFSDLSLYQLSYTALISDNKYESPEITIEGLIFNQRLSMDVDPNLYLTSMWDNLRNRK